MASSPCKIDLLSRKALQVVWRILFWLILNELEEQLTIKLPDDEATWHIGKVAAIARSHYYLLLARMDPTGLSSHCPIIAQHVMQGLVVRMSHRELQIWPWKPLEHCWDTNCLDPNYLMDKLKHGEIALQCMQAEVVTNECGPQSLIRAPQRVRGLQKKRKRENAKTT